MGRLAACCGGVWDGERAGLGEGTIKQDPDRVDQKAKADSTGSNYCLRRRELAECRKSLLELYDVRWWRHWWKVICVKEDFDGYLGLPRCHAISHAEDKIASLKKARFFDGINMFEDFVEELNTTDLSVMASIDERS